MAATVYNLTPAWSASARYTAAADVDVMLSNPAMIGALIAFTITTSDTAPTITPGQATKIGALGFHAMQLVSGERLWMAVDGPANAIATLEV